MIGKKQHMEARIGREGYKLTGVARILWTTATLTLSIGITLQHASPGRAGNPHPKRYSYSDVIKKIVQRNAHRTPVYGYRIVNKYPHNPASFTQGLLYDKGFLYESTGLYGKSSIRKVDVTTGKALRTRRLPDHYFGEGLGIWKGRLVQLTWRSRTGFVYDKDLNKIGEFAYRTEGWGMTQNEKSMIMSDGSDILRFWEPVRFKEVGRLRVHDHGSPVGFINELEYIKGEIYANIWGTDYIARISPDTGEILGWIDLSGLLTSSRLPSGSVLNGIAYDRVGDRLFVTGKSWPIMFEIRLVP